MIENKMEDDEDIDIFIGETVFNKYKLLKKIGQGAFGSIYEAKSTKNNDLFAVKLEDMKQGQYILEEESLLLSHLNCPRVPKIECFGYSCSYIILVMELLGKSLDKIFNENNLKILSIRCVCNIAYQLISILELIHNRDIIHRDLKPSNIAIGGEGKNKFIYLLDFGLSIKYRCPETKKHFPFVKNKKLIGNARYSSINALEGGTQSRRDDLESLGYLLIYLLKGKLPWQGNVSHSNDDKYYKIKKIKKETTPEKLCEGLPQQLEEYIKYTQNLEYEEKPNYNYLKNLFLIILDKNNFIFDYFYDWDKVILTDNEKKDMGKFSDELDKNKNNNLNGEFQTSKLTNQISDLITERKKNRGVFDNDRFILNIEEKPNYNIQILKSDNQNNIKTEVQLNYNGINNLLPSEYPNERINQNYNKKNLKKKYKNSESTCCIIY